MGSKVMINYKYKVFSTDELKQFALSLSNFLKIPTSACKIFLDRKEDGFTTSKETSIEEFSTKIEIGTPPDSIGFHYQDHIILLNLENTYRKISILYMLNSDMDYSKKIVSFVENALELTKLAHEGEKSKRQTGKNPNNFVRESNNESSIGFSYINVWNEIKLRLQSILPKEAYLTWIDALIPSLDGSKLTLHCKNEFAKIWLESRYRTVIEETVLSFDPCINEIIFEIFGEDSSTKNGEKHYHLKLEESLYELMKEVFEKENENALEEKAFEKYFNQIILSYCQERIG